MAFPALRTGRPPGRPQTNWLPFEEARAFARSLGLRSCREWRVYHSQNKLTLAKVPVNPEPVYRNHGYINMYDWLGKERYPVFSETGLKNLKPSSTYLNWKGAHRISEFLSASQPVDGERFHLFPMPRESRFTFLYRVALSNKSVPEQAGADFEDWAPLSIRVSGRTTNVAFYLGQKYSDHPLVCADLQRERFYILPPGSSASRLQTTYFCPSKAHEVQFRVSSDDLQTVLRAWWESDGAEPMKKSVDLWLRDSVDHKQGGQWIDWILQVKDLLYKPLEVRLAFSHNLQQELHNSFVNDAPAIHQTACRTSDSTCLVVDLDKKAHRQSNLRLAFVERTKIAFAICGVRKEECTALAGIFCFPQKILVERGIFGSETKPERPIFSVFPPWFLNRVPRMKKSRKAAEWQREFYIDLSEAESSPEKMQHARHKLKKILSENSFSNSTNNW